MRILHESLWAIFDQCLHTLHREKFYSVRLSRQFNQGSLVKAGNLPPWRQYNLNMPSIWKLEAKSRLRDPGSQWVIPPLNY